MTDVPQPALPLVIRTAIAGEQGLLILDAQFPFIDPDRDTLPRQARFRIDREPLYTHKPIAIDHPEKLDLPEELSQCQTLDRTPPNPFQHFHRRSASIVPLSMRPVPCGV